MINTKRNNENNENSAKIYMISKLDYYYYTISLDINILFFYIDIIHINSIILSLYSLK